MSHRLLGYFTAAGQLIPTYDPGWLATPCLICLEPLNGPEGIRTISLMWDKVPERSWFYRVHRPCDARISQTERVTIEESVLMSEVHS